MTATDDVTTCNGDHNRRWLGTGRDGAWPDHHATPQQRPWRLAALCNIGRKIARRIVIARPDQCVRPVRSPPSRHGATVKSP